MTILEACGEILYLVKTDFSSKSNLTNEHTNTDCE